MAALAPDPFRQLTEIRAIMERSSKFISLSGLSGVGAGVVALLGVAAVRGYLGGLHPAQEYGPAGYSWLLASSLPERLAALPVLAGLAAATIALALLVAAFFTLRRTRREGLRSLWTAPARRLAVALIMPLVAGGLFCLRLYLSAAPELVLPAMLLFYGLALLNGSKYTLDEIKYLGLTQVLLGLGGLALPAYGLALFAVGFGLGHIGYGLLMYNRYERPAGAATLATP